MPRIASALLALLIAPLIELTAAEPPGRPAKAPATATQTAPFEFAGIVTHNEVWHFILFDFTTKQNSFWLKRGQSWHGAEVLSFDATQQLLLVRHDGKELRLPLRNAKIGTALPGGMLVRGSFVRGDDGTLIYSADAEVLLEEGVSIRSASGIMASDPTQTFFVGDLTVKNNDVTLLVGNVTYDRAKRTFRTRGSPTLSIEAARQGLEKK